MKHLLAILLAGFSLGAAAQPASTEAIASCRADINLLTARQVRLTDESKQLELEATVMNQRSTELNDEVARSRAVSTPELTALIGAVRDQSVKVGEFMRRVSVHDAEVKAANQQAAEVQQRCGRLQMRVADFQKVCSGAPMTDVFCNPR
jgi:hypothetical protein